MQLRVAQIPPLTFDGPSTSFLPMAPPPPNQRPQAQALEPITHTGLSGTRTPDAPIVRAMRLPACFAGPDEPPLRSALQPRGRKVLGLEPA